MFAAEEVGNVVHIVWGKAMALEAMALGTCMKSSIVRDSYFIYERFIYEP